MSEDMEETVALAMEETMFASHELPLDDELHAKYRGTAKAAIEAMSSSLASLPRYLRERTGMIPHESGEWLKREDVLKALGGGQ